MLYNAVASFLVFFVIGNSSLSPLMAHLFVATVFYVLAYQSMEMCILAALG